MFTATLPAQLAPAHIIGENVDDVRFLAELLLQRREFLVDGLVLLRPFVLVSLLVSQEGPVGLKGGRARQAKLAPIIHDGHRI